MELVVDGRPVLLTTHKSYSEPNELRSLYTFSQYPPLLSYLKTCAESGTVPNAVVVRQVRRIAHRITGAVVDVVFDSAHARTSRTHVLQLTSAPPAALVPIIMAEGRRYALLTRESSLSQGLCPILSALRGTVAATGAFACPDHEAALQELQLSCAEATPVSTHPFTIGNEGEPPLHLFSLTAVWEGDAVRRIESHPDLVLVPIEDVVRAGDAAAALVVTLLSASV